MNMNLESLRFKRGESWLEMYMRNIGRDESDSYKEDVLYIPLPEVQDMLKCLRGTMGYAPFFADGSYLLQLSKRGARYLRLDSYCNGSGGKYKEYWYNFDGEWFAFHLESAFNTLKVEQKFSVSVEDINEERIRLAPRVEWVYGEGVEDGLDTDRAIENIYVDDYGNAHTVQSCLDRIQRMAENQSDGQVITVNFWFDFGGNRSDGRPNMYYYEVYDLGKSTTRLWNGGVVPSDYHDGLWQFSTHS